MLERFHAEYLEFKSHEYSYIQDITDEVNEVIVRGTENTVDSGTVGIYSGHTTFGLFIGERGEKGLPIDLQNHSFRLIPQDRISARGQNPNYPFPKTTEEDDYLHDCSRNVHIPKGRIDLGHNSAEHTRYQLFTSSDITRPFIKRKMVLGTFQGLHVWEFDGRSDAERSGKEEEVNSGRTRTIMVCVYPMPVSGLTTTYISS